jgi:fructosamine-3-kinase
MSQEMDISWETLGRIARQWAGDSAELAQVTPLDGGAISTTVAMQLADERKAVLKISAHRVDRSYINEAHQLRMLAEMGIPVPRVYAAKLGSLDDPYSYILMEFMPGVDLREARKRCSDSEYDGLQENLAEIVQHMHCRTSENYTRLEIEPVANEFSDWPKFFHHIFDGICEEVLQQPLIPIKGRKQIERIHARLDSLLAHDDVPRLVHWDIWATNVLAQPDEAGNWRVSAVLDPNCKFAHVEAELAYMALFQTSTPAFRRAYQKTREQGDDYHKIRKPVYQLYYLLNHIRLFGAEYLKPTMETLDRLAAVI